MNSLSFKLSSRVIAIGIAMGLLPSMAVAAPSPQRLETLRMRPSDRAAALAVPGTTAKRRHVAHVEAALRTAKGRQQIIVRLAEPTDAAPLTSRSPHDRKRVIEQTQQQFLERFRPRAFGARVLARTQLVLNAVFLEVDATAIPAIASDLAVERIARVRDYQLDLSETVPQIGASVVQAAGFDGTGIRVAVLDSGIDYTHAKLGGPGTEQAYEDAYGTDPSDPRNTTLDELFPTERVVGGYDFVGEEWVGGDDSPPLLPDPDPIAAAVTGGHGTHVADIIGGTNGVAPGVDLYAVKVCSAISSSCSGIALIQGMEFAVDPNGDGDTSDRMDLINMSLGSSYGQAFDDHLSAAVDNATALGILTVASAGNGADHPYITGTPAATQTAISVAQTQVASVRDTQNMSVVDPPEAAGDYVAVHQPWSGQLSGVIEGAVQYGDGAGGALNGCSLDPNDPLGTNPFAPDSLSGKIVYVDRGACYFSEKIYNIEAAGGILGIIGTIDDSIPFPGGYGGNTPEPIIAGYMISNADADILRAGNAIVRFDLDNLRIFAGNMVVSSSRGPTYDNSGLKPEIGAPGASVSAEAGFGTLEAPFGGTSGAAPMVTGSAALLLQATSLTRPLEIKALLMNTAERDVVNNYAGEIAPVSRIGSGEVRVDRAVAAEAVAWVEEDATAALTFGFVEVADKVAIHHKTVHISNLSNKRLSFALTSTFRFADDELTGAVQLLAPPRISLRPGKTQSFPVTLVIHGDKLPNNVMNSGSRGDDPSALTANEYDGYLLLQPVYGDTQPIHLPWHVLPRKAARVQPLRPKLSFRHGTSIEVPVVNLGVGVAQMDTYSLLALSADLPEGDRGEEQPIPDIRAFGVQTADGTGIPDCGEYVLALAFTSWERESLAHCPGSYSIQLDTDQDGAGDYLVVNDQLNSFGVSGDRRNVTAVFDLNLGGGSFFFFTENATNTANTVLRLCASQIGDHPIGRQVDAMVRYDDIYFGGPGDVLDEVISFAPGGERYVAEPVEDLEAFSSGSLVVEDLGEEGTNPTELGLLVMTNADRGAQSRGGATRGTEALILTTRGKRK